MYRLAVIPFLLLPALASAQVSVNPSALSGLKPDVPAAAAAPAAKAAPQKSSSRPPSKPRHPPADHAKPPAKPAPKPASKPAPSAPPVQAPAPPPAAALPPVPPPPVPAKPPAPPPPVPVVPGAAGQVTQIPNGIRITFGEGSADLNPATSAALQALGQAIRDKPAADLNIYAYATGVPDDPSTPRRLSLSRALAARQVLINEGIASTRIYPRALGATVPDGPPDRVDVVQTGPGSQPPPAATPAH